MRARHKLGKILSHENVLSGMADLKTIFVTLLTGIACPLAIGSMVTEGSIVLAIIVLVLLSGTGTSIAIILEKRTGGRPKLWRAVVGFTVGSMLIHLASFIHYYNSYGYMDAKLNVSITLSIISFIVVAVIGDLTACVVHFICRRIEFGKAIRRN